MSWISSLDIPVWEFRFSNANGGTPTAEFRNRDFTGGIAKLKFGNQNSEIRIPKSEFPSRNSDVRIPNWNSNFCTCKSEFRKLALCSSTSHGIVCPPTPNSAEGPKSEFGGLEWVGGKGNYRTLVHMTEF